MKSSKEPALIVSAIVAAIVAVAGSFGIVVDTQSLTTIVAEVLVVLAGGVTTRSKVTPAE